MSLFNAAIWIVSMLMGPAIFYGLPWLTSGRTPPVRLGLICFGAIFCAALLFFSTQMQLGSAMAGALVFGSIGGSAIANRWWIFTGRER